MYILFSKSVTYVRITMHFHRDKQFVKDCPFKGFSTQYDKTSKPLTPDIKGKSDMPCMPWCIHTQEQLHRRRPHYIGKLAIGDTDKHTYVCTYRGATLHFSG